jgi:hypothetical protein
VPSPRSSAARRPSLALLPSGTGNLLARNLDLTLDDMEHSVRTAFDGVDRRIDLAWADIRREGGAVERAAYLVMAGFGLDAKMLSNTDEELKAKVGWLAYVDAIRKALRDENHMRMRYRVDGAARTASRRTRSSSATAVQLPANILLLPTAAIDDGRFEAVFLRPESAWGWIQILVKVIWENGVLRRTRWGRKLVGRRRRRRPLRERSATRRRAQPPRGGRARRRHLRPCRCPPHVDRRRRAHGASPGRRGGARPTVTDAAASVGPVDDPAADPRAWHAIERQRGANAAWKIAHARPATARRSSKSVRASTSASM